MPQERRAKQAKAAKSRPTRIESRITQDNPLSIHADGVWGGITPKGLVVMGFFTEKFAPPDKVTYELPDSVPGPLTEVSRQGGGYVQRDIQAQVFLNADVAKSLIEWLEDKVTKLEVMDKEIAGKNRDSAASGTITVEDEK